LTGKYKILAVQQKVRCFCLRWHFWSYYYIFKNIGPFDAHVSVRDPLPIGGDLLWGWLYGYLGDQARYHPVDWEGGIYTPYGLLTGGLNIWLKARFFAPLH
jgi:hypothetical protein